MNEARLKEILKEQGAMLDRVKAEGRGLTEDEQERYDKLDSEWTDIKAGPLKPIPEGQYIPESDEFRALKPSESFTEAIGAENRKGLSFGRLVKGAVTGQWNGAEKEQRAMIEGSDSLGGFLVPSPLSARVIDKARAKSVCFRAGANTVPMKSDKLDFARVKDDFTAYWRRENQAITASDMAFEKITLHARVLACLGKMSIEVLEDSENLESVVTNSLAQTIALGLDRALLRGDSQPGAEPNGFENWSDINTIPVGGALTGYSDVLDGLQDIEEANGDVSMAAIIMSPARKYDFAKMLSGEGMYLKPPKEWEPLKKLVTTQVEDSKLYLGDYSQMYVGIRNELRVDFSKEAADTSDSAFAQMQVWVRAFMRADVVASHEDHFCLLSTIT
jgi:HK97 family phage major capsid protein